MFDPAVICEGTIWRAFDAATSDDVGKTQGACSSGIGENTGEEEYKDKADVVGMFE